MKKITIKQEKIKKESQRSYNVQTAQQITPEEIISERQIIRNNDQVKQNTYIKQVLIKIEDTQD